VKVLTMHIWLRNEDGPIVTADVEIPGLGELKITECLSNDTVERLCKEVEAATRAKFNLSQALGKV
jgi:hypothetical protein